MKNISKERDFDAIRPGCVVTFEKLLVQKVGEAPFVIIPNDLPEFRVFKTASGLRFSVNRDTWETCGGQTVSWPEEVSTETKRSREEQVQALACMFPNGPTPMAIKTAENYNRESEARGAAEQRRKDAEGNNPRFFIQHDGGGLWEYTQEDWLADDYYTPENKFVFFDRPANVAALEARIAELEAEKLQLKAYISAIHPGSLRAVIHAPTRFMDDNRPALTLEGAV
ncbi:hypothetical protein HKD24_06280 [Gluconobacter sp. LMG 31484]|uniref:Uncharacterized protein n=1 Tax=Gluconobacter vitians TaxID=2728102 RepID=A0ABR9Y505_9PROT|nr:hypothetical protein [Gluconobacter vitians]MBF0858820.1 hypothetical protein [Gluconobacter vitians]